MRLPLLSIPILALLARASPVERAVSARASSEDLVPLSAAELEELRAFARFTEVAYYSSESVMTWSCGEACDASSGVTPIDAGGDDEFMPGWYVAHSAPLNAIVVAQSGTNFASNVSISLDNLVELQALNPILYPGVPTDQGILAHAGFMLSQTFTAPRMLYAVQAGVKQFGTNNVVVTGHSLGGSLATLNALFLKLQMPSLNVKNRAYAPPRVGNPAFAAFYPTIVPDAWRVNSRNDIVPQIPATDLGYEHSPGEVYISMSGSVNFCPGNENVNCADSVSQDTAIGPDHLGPYEGVTLGGIPIAHFPHVGA